jgi:hypothetical protein
MRHKLLRRRSLQRSPASIRVADAYFSPIHALLYFIQYRYFNIHPSGSFACPFINRRRCRWIPPSRRRMRKHRTMR